MDRILALVVITLLQLSRAQIPDLPPGSWFSANAINDGFSPKPISELFSTEASPGFSSTKPIIVLPEFSLSPEPKVTLLSSTVTNFGSIPSSTPLTPVSFSTTVAPPTSFSGDYSSSLDFSQTPSIASQWPTDTTVLQSQTTRPVQTLQQSFGTSPQSPSSDPPNFIVVYQNTPQSISTQRTTGITQASTIASHPVSTTPTTFTASISDGTPFITSDLSDGTSRPTVTFRSTPPVNLSPSTTPRTTILTNNSPSTRLISSVTTPLPLRIVTGPPPAPFKPRLTIQVVAPKGSITNLRINPPTTTKAPTTKRTKKPKRNSYEGCLDGCRGRKDPICTVPISSVIIDPKTLKGFPSICHMACHNSYKKDAYEKLLDGRCGRLRTRIISVDSNTKIQREELKKAEYSVINNGPKTVVEFAQARSN